MRSRGFAMVAMAVTVICCLVGSVGKCGAAAEGKIKLQVLYVGYPGSDREKDFVGFLEKHFVKVGKADLEKFETEDARDFDLMVIDYSGLTIKENTIITPRTPFDRMYSRPVLTIGAAGALVSDRLGLKTGYL